MGRPPNPGRECVEEVGQANLTTKSSKCQVGIRLCTNPGHIVGSSMVRSEESKVEAIRQFRKSLMKNEFKIFLG